MSGLPWIRHRYLGAYLSDGLQVYFRLDVPATAATSGGYPTVVFIHGWVGEQAALTYNFEGYKTSSTAAVIEAHVDAGFVVLIPGLRGHGTVSGYHAEGLEFLRAWENRGYLSPMFYTIDVLNLIAGLESFDSLDGRMRALHPTIQLDPKRINVVGYSQGSDVALTTLEVAGEKSMFSTPIHAAPIWPRCSALRIAQAAMYGPVQDTAMAFAAGDRAWSGSAVAVDGSVNRDFIFPYPSDWIANPLPDDWTWQVDQWHLESVGASLQKTYTEMYAACMEGINDLKNLKFTIERDRRDRLKVTHAAGLEQQRIRLCGYYAVRYLTEPVNLHSSDRDFYSLPALNSDLTTRVNTPGGRMHHYVYPCTKHSLPVSLEAWFSPAGTLPEWTTMVARDIALFRGRAAR